MTLYIITITARYRYMTTSEKDAYSFAKMFKAESVNPIEYNGLPKPYIMQR